jgi:hypothetical protein
VRSTGSLTADKGHLSGVRNPVREDTVNTALTDQLAAAVRDIREQTAGLEDVHHDPAPDAAAGALAALERAEQCEHLRAVPVQPTYLLLYMTGRPGDADLAPIARCTPCFTGDAAALAHCPRCDRRASRPRQGATIETGHVLVLMFLCFCCDGVKLPAG